ncbi:ATP-binding protein [Enterococcus sp. JM4C]|uniref:TFIIB-type zinc ribbon-containing protein n=1 Tax=Candidatus Enterococcus huntleyi TaxID=1857217 RepID=UPI00137B3517|nr:TFIIB-type zinc ribbon-containing protein [Enterococcus sp. JM4C]KAF1296242.1 ATP-binding protein [Enterococcus sp. JM4C]
MDVLTHKCPNCGGPLTFEPKDQKFHCDFCLSIFTAEEVSQYEEKQRAASVGGETSAPDTEPHDNGQSTGSNSATAKETLASSEVASEPTDETSAQEDASTMELFLCPSCGAEIVTDATTAATYCYYCHNPVVLSGRLSGQFLPEKVLPFAVEKEEAVEKFLAWTKKKWFIPKDFFDKSQIDKLTGVYFPYWTVDAKLAGQLSANATAVRVWRIGDIEYTETKQFQVFRKGKLSFKELLKNALSKNTQQKMVEQVQPFPLEKAIDFKSQYLAGFQAEKRDIEYGTIRDTVKRELRDYSENLLRDTASGYATLTNVQTNIALDEEKNHYVLLPVWLVTYRGNSQSDKVYYYAMNGQTGKVSGVLPMSYKRLGFATAGLFAVLATLFLIGGYFI